MSIYYAPDALLKPEYKYLFELARDNRQDICNTIFDKESIKKFNDEYGMLSEENLDFVIKALDEIKDDQAYTDLCCILYIFMKNDVYPNDIKPIKDKSLKSEFALMISFFACVSDFCDDALKRGVDKEILSTTLKAVDMYINANKNRSGVAGTSSYHEWLPRYAMGKLFRIGAFQFEIHSNDIISVHIPRGTVLNVADNLINFREALEFFNKYYPEYDFKTFGTSSWLLNPHIEEIMGRPTNITRFGDMFQRIRVNPDEEGVYTNLFKMAKPQDLNELPEETSMQRNVKKYLMEGNVFNDYVGGISLERLQKLISEING